MRDVPPEVRRFIDDARVCRIATTAAGGSPHLIPVCPVYDGERTLYVDLGPDSRTGRAIAHGSRVAVLIDEYDDDWTKLRKVILHCDARIAEGAERDGAWDRIRRKFPQYTTVGWVPRMTVALRIEGWVQEGLLPGTPAA
jgi:nitroimidazol reductase NimA-like FMN-containing flavoprotein (pyridoxamine 5'-phosphate oxidase superfamily)